MPHQFTTWKTAFAQMTDPRQAKGQRYPWWVLLTLIAAAMVSGQVTMSAVSQWVAEHADELRQTVWPRLPSDATLRRALGRMPLADLEAIMRREPPPEPGLVAHALDGKTIRGASAHGPMIHVVREVQHGSGIVLHQHVVDVKTNAIPVVRQMLAGRDLTGTIFTLDALHTQQETTKLILAQGGHSLLIAKANQRTLLEAITTWFDADPWPEEQRQGFVQREKGHGRHEYRKLERMVCPPRLRTLWPGVRQVLRRTCCASLDRSGQRRQAVTYALCDLPPEQASLHALAGWWRGHWTIENVVHYQRDGTWREDACQVARGQAPVALSLLRDGITDTLHLAGFRNMAAALRHFGAVTARALAFVGC